jgi:hypothetical protein
VAPGAARSAPRYATDWLNAVRLSGAQQVRLRDPQAESAHRHARDEDRNRPRCPDRVRRPALVGGGGTGQTNPRSKPAVRPQHVRKMPFRTNGNQRLPTPSFCSSESFRAGDLQGHIGVP